MSVRSCGSPHWIGVCHGFALWLKSALMIVVVNARPRTEPIYIIYIWNCFLWLIVEVGIVVALFDNNCVTLRKTHFINPAHVILYLLKVALNHLFCHLLQHFGGGREVEVGRAVWILTDTSAFSLAQGGWAQSSCCGYVDGVRSQNFTDKLCQVLTLSLGNEQTV